MKLVLAEGFNLPLSHQRTRKPVVCLFALDELPPGEVRFGVCPRNCFGKKGSPLLTDWMNSTDDATPT